MSRLHKDRVLRTHSYRVITGFAYIVCAIIVGLSWAPSHASDLGILIQDANGTDLGYAFKLIVPHSSVSISGAKATMVYSPAGTAAIATSITTSDNQTDTTEFPVLVGAATGDLGPRTRSTLTFNAVTGLLSSTLFGGDGSGLTGIGTAKATALTIAVRAGEYLRKGQAVYISGTSAGIPVAYKVDSTVLGKSRAIGVAQSDMNPGDATIDGFVRRGGTLTGIDARTTGTVAGYVNPLQQTWANGDLLFALGGANAGGLTNVRPTSGRSVKVAYAVNGNDPSCTFLMHVMENPVWVTGAVGEDVVLRLGDAIGANKVSVRDYANAEVASVNSDGGGVFSSAEIGTTAAGGNLSVNATLGAELITAPMVTGGWTLGYDTGGWAITAGVLSKTASTGTLTATAVTGMTSAPTAGVTYKVVIVSSAASGSTTYTLGGVTGTTISTATTTTDYITASTTAKLIFSGVAATTVSISSVSVKALTDATGDLTVDGNLRVRSPILAFRSTTSYPAYSFVHAPTMGMNYDGSSYITLGTGTTTFATGDLFTWFNSTYGLGFSSALDLILIRDAASTLAQRRGTTQQVTRLYNTWTDASNYERLTLTGVQGASVNLTAETAGTGGDNLDVVLTPAGTGMVKVVGKQTSARYTKAVSTTPVTLTAAEVCNATIKVSAAATINLPNDTTGILDGCRLTFRATGAAVITINPDDSDYIDLVGTSLAVGVAAVSDGFAGTSIDLEYDHAATTWRSIATQGLIVAGT